MEVHQKIVDRSLKVKGTTGMILCFLLLPFWGWSQTGNAEKGNISGIVLEAGSSKRLAKVSIRNKNQNTKTSTDLKGEFVMLVSIGDTLILSSLGYESEQAVIKTFSDILIDLKPTSIMLETISVNRQNKAAELQDVLDSYSRHGIYQGGKPSVMSYIFSPITSVYERFSKKGKQARNFRNFMENELQASHIDRLFSRYKVMSLTDLEGEDLNNFMLLYRPSFEKASTWGEYDFTKYIADSYQKFIADGKPQASRLPRITSDTKF